MEEEIYETCPDLVKECAVVGHLRLSPALFVVPHRDGSSTVSEDSMKTLILERIEDFNARRYVHEVIEDRRLIFIINDGVLPKTVS